MMLTTLLLAAVMLASAGAAESTPPPAAPEPAAASRLALAAFMLPADGLPEGCAPIGEGHGVSLQAEVLYGGERLGGVLTARPVAKQAQPMRCGKDEGAVYYYEFATEADAERTLGFIKGDIWGEDHPTSMHPELIDRWSNIIVVISLRHPEPVEKALMAKTPGGISAAKPTAEMTPAVKKELSKAVEAYGKKDFAKAEKSFRSIVASTPDDALAHMYLAHTLFYQERFRESIPEYEKARDLADRSAHFEMTNQRILNDNLGMAYGLTGRLEDAKKHFQAAIRGDPDYPEYYYNLACAQAELGDLDGALANLKATYDRKGNFLPGESMSNPREDDSFKKYVGNPKFESALREMGF
jgi:tetratricopeptide (TPR) repeat protein